MRKKPSLLVPVLGLLLLLAFGAVLFLLLRGPRSIETFEDALAEARRAGKPIFVKIIADT